MVLIALGSAIALWELVDVPILLEVIWDGMADGVFTVFSSDHRFRARPQGCRPCLSGCAQAPEGLLDNRIAIKYVRNMVDCNLMAIITECGHRNSVAMR